MFEPGEIEFAYVDIDRTVIGSAVPESESLTLETEPELRAEYFLERRELGVFNVGGAGSVVVDGKSFDMAKLDCLYVGRGSRSVTFSSKNANDPAYFYLLSYPAHKENPTAIVKFADLKGSELASFEHAKSQTSYKRYKRMEFKAASLWRGSRISDSAANGIRCRPKRPFA